MAAPIAIELVTGPPSGERDAQALVVACSEAAGPGGCIASHAGAAAEARARVVVVFGEGALRVRVEARTVSLDPQAPGRFASREATFRESDPLIERFRATGLIVAGLVSDLSRVSLEAAPSGALDDGAPIAAPSMATVDATPSAEARALDASATQGAVALSLAGIATVAAERPRLGGALMGDFRPAGSPFFLTTSASYEQTVQADTEGISNVRGNLGVGAGAAVRIPRSQLWIRGRARFQIEGLRVSVDEPQSGKRDAARVLLPGLAADAEILWAVSADLGLFVGLRAAWVDANVAVSVAGAPQETISAWSADLAVGATLRWP